MLNYGPNLNQLILNLSSRMTSLLGLVACAFCLVGCSKSLARKWEFKEVKRTPSPDGRFEAVILTGEAGATTSVVTVVRVVKAGEKIGHGRPQDNEVVLWADNLKNFVVLWKQPKLLDVCFDEARIDIFKNHQEIETSQDAWDVAEIRLCPKNPISLPEEDRTPFGNL